MKGRVAFVLSYDYVLISTLIEDMHVLAKMGYQVDVFAQAKSNWEINPRNERIQIHWFKGDRENGKPKNLFRVSKSARQSRKNLKMLVRSVSRSAIYPILYRIVLSVPIFISMLVKVLRVTRGKRYSCFIGVEPGGLLLATIAGIIHRVPVVYYNMELLLSHEIQDKHKFVVKWLERKCNSMTVLTIIQDEKRATELSLDNNVPLSGIAIVPCGMAGPAIEKRTGYLHEKFGIPASDRIVLYASKITSWARVAEVAEQAIHWPDGWVLIIHGFPRHSEYVSKVRKIITQGNGRVIISDEMLPQEQFETLVGSADIGIALYADLGANFRHTGSSSIKLAVYLKCGLPVITNDYPSMREVIEKYKCGVCVHEESEVIRAAELIMKDYDHYRANAQRCFADHYDLKPHWRDVIDSLKRNN